jgi:hypothetical protein
LSVDAKPSIQARGRCHPTAPAEPGKPVRVEHEYVRHGPLALLAALNARTGKVLAGTAATTQRKVISPNDFASLDALAGTLLAFVDRYNQGARPFK